MSIDKFGKNIDTIADDCFDKVKKIYQIEGYKLIDGVMVSFSEEITINADRDIVNPMPPLTNYRLILPDGSIVDKSIPANLNPGDVLDIDLGQFTVMLSEPAICYERVSLYLKRQE